ncbi:MAG: hypothetical protein ABIJ56_14625 [Pseudomonadota bacterium]
MESRSISGSLDLLVTAADKAELSLDIKEYLTFGPSLGKFKQGQTDFTHRFWLEKRAWKGHAERRGDTLIVTFETVDAARQEFDLYSKGSLPPAVQTASTLELTCRYDELDVYGPAAKSKSVLNVDKEKPKKTRALLCKPSQEEFDWYQEYVLIGESLPFGAAPGFILGYSKMYWTETKVLRKVK